MTSTSVSIPRQRPGPDTQRRFADVLGAAAVVVTLGQYWLAPVLWRGDGALGASEHPLAAGAEVVATLGQFAPLILVAAGATAEATATTPKLVGRLRRRATAAIPLTGIWIPLPAVLAELGVSAPPVTAAADAARQVLALVIAYVILTAATPALARLHRRWRGREIVIPVAAVAVLDTVGLAEPGGTASNCTGQLGMFAVAVAAYQAGIVQACGGFDRVRARTAWAVAATTYAVATILLVAPLPVRPVTLPGAPIAASGVAVDGTSATLVLVLAVAHLAAALAVRPGIEHWLATTPVALHVTGVADRLLTILLWHTPALVLVTWVAAGWRPDVPLPFTEAWREQLAWWVLALAVVLAVLVRLCARMQRPRTTAPAAARHPRPVGTAPLRIHRMPGSSIAAEHGRLNP